MNTIRLAILFLVLIASRLAAGAAEAAADSLEDADAEPPAAAGAAEPESAPDRTWNLGLLLPRRLQVGVHAGLLASRLHASTDYAALLEPTAARDRAWKSPSWGAVMTARWGHAFSLTLAPRYETYGLDTREETVAFPDNPFPHTLKASTRLGYVVWPLLAGMGWTGAHQRVDVALGVYSAWLDNHAIRWVVDGEEYPHRPEVAVDLRHTGWLVSTGYGLRLGRGELFAGVEAKQGFQSLLHGLEGSVRTRTLRASLAYLWTVYRR